MADGPTISDEVTRGGGKDANTYNNKDGLYTDINKQNGGDPFKNALENTEDWELAYMRQDASKSTYIDDEDAFREQYIKNKYGSKTQKSTSEQKVSATSTKADLANVHGSTTYSQNYIVPEYETDTATFISDMSQALENSAQWAEFYPEVQGRHNVLHDFNSYNYNITLVALSQDQINDPTTYKGRIINATGAENPNFYIVAKSGGFTRQNSPTSDAAASFKSDPTIDPRNTDLFIENLEFETRPGINDMGNSNLTTGTFEVTEPHSVSQFYRELFNGAKFAGHADYIDAPFLLVISFIGRKAEEEDAIIPEKTTRYIPIKIQNSEMQVDESGARYSVKFLGFNSTATRTVVNTLWDDTTPLKNEKESVESITASVFLKQTKNEAEHYAKFIEELKGDAEKLTEVENLVTETSQAFSKKGVKTEVGYFKPNKYFVHYAPGYVVFPKTAKALSSKSANWTETVSGWTDDTTFKSAPKVSDPGNEMGDAGLSKKMKPSGALKIDSYDAEVERRKDELKAKKDVLNQNRTTLNTSLRAFDTKRQTLYGLLKKSGIREDDTVTDKLKDPSLGVFSKTEEAKKAVDTKKEEAVALADKLANFASGGATGPDGNPAQAKLTPAEIATVTKLRGEIIDLSGQIQTDADAVAKIDLEVKALEEDFAGWIQGGDVTYDLTSAGGEPWSFRKGTTLMTVIETMITNSEYMDIFKEESKINAIVDSEMIPWFSVEVLTKIIGFDVITMRNVHEFHYIVTPYNIHYSSMPGINVIFTTQKLRKMAVREYNYLYTGKNLDVLSYNIRYNNLFTTPLLLNPPTFTNDKKDDTKEETTQTLMDKETLQEILSKRLTNKVGQSGSTPATPIKRLYAKESINNRDAIGTIFQDFLYNPPYERHLILSDIDIIGDPVYIQGSGITERPNVRTTDITTPDGEMNSFTHEPHVILNIRYPDDLPTSAELDANKYEQKLMTDQYTGVFQIFNVRNSFSEGVFKQTLRLARKRNQPADFTDSDELGQT